MLPLPLRHADAAILLMLRFVAILLMFACHAATIRFHALRLLPPDATLIVDDAVWRYVAADIRAYACAFFVFFFRCRLLPFRFFAPQHVAHHHQRHSTSYTTVSSSRLLTLILLPP